MPEIYIVDSIMGSGKTSAIINMINNSTEDEHFLVITPYLAEVQRYIKSCPKKKFIQPKFDENSTKLDDIKKLFSSGKNIVSTHSLFHKFTENTIEFCHDFGYTLIMDEVADVIDEMKVSKKDYDTLIEKYIDIDEKTKLCSWRESEQNYQGVFNNYKIACNNGSLAAFNNQFFVWLFPVNVFNAFNKVYILTYLFNAQIQKYYYDYFNLQYSFLGVSGNSIENYTIQSNAQEHIKQDYSKLITILDNKKMNNIGELQGSLSKTWYDRHADDDNTLLVLKRNLLNFFCNIQKSPIKQNLWTTFADYKPKLKGMGYTKQFCPMNMRATNDYKDAINVAYMVNRFFNPYIKNFFFSNNIAVSEDLWALSEMLQFIWRSGIRENKPITVYVPSKRMRELLQSWVNETTERYREETNM